MQDLPLRSAHSTKPVTVAQQLRQQRIYIAFVRTFVRGTLIYVKGDNALSHFDVLSGRLAATRFR